ncbi:MAG: serine hydrolase [Planctomycetes bacterium]|nr:serine hydrolase [Planctomycetota bacterium]
MIKRLFATLFVLLATSLDPRAAFGQEFPIDLDLDASEFTTVIGERRLSGYQPVSVTVHQVGVNGGTGPVLFQVVWRQNFDTDWAATSNLSLSQYQSWSTSQAALGRRPLCVGAYGQSSNAKYVSVWGKDEFTAWNQRVGMTQEEYEAEVLAMEANEFRPTWVSANGIGSQVRFSAIWVQDQRKSCHAQGLFQEDLNQAIIDNRMIGCRLISAAAYGPDFSPLFGGVWIKGEQPPWDYSHYVSKPELQAMFEDYQAQGYRPTFITSYDTPTGIRYTASWEAIDQTAIWRMAGPLVPSMSNIDSAMNQFMVERHVPNASIAVVKDGRLVLARGYTNAPTNWPTTSPTSLFRIASLTKPLTSVGVMKLVESGAIQFDQPINTILNTSGWTDSRINSVTVRDLLQHRGGWDVSVSGIDPMSQDFNISAELNVPLPVTTGNVIDFMKSRPLDNQPGLVFAYSNFGYCMLGRVIEAVTGQPYDAWIKANVLAPIGIQRIHRGRSEQGRQWAGEVPYVDAYQRVVLSVMGESTAPLVPLSYGGWNLSLLDSSGGWVTSAVDYAKFAATFRNIDASPLLARSTIDQMWSRPPEELETNPAYYAAGFLVQPLQALGHYEVSHTGSFNGSSSWMRLRDDGVQWIVMMNVNGIEELPPMSDLSGIIDTEIDSITNWPAHDLFSQYSVPDAAVFINVLIGSDTDAGHVMASDLNADGWVDGRDIAGFVQTMTGW